MATAKTKEVNNTLETEVRQRQSKKKQMLEAFKKQDKVQVSGSPFYKPYFGEVMVIMLNGITTAVPLDGRPHEIPAAFADEFYTRIHRIDAQNERMGILAANIEEDYIGAVDLTVD